MVIVVQNYLSAANPQTNKSDQCSEAILVTKDMSSPILVDRVEPSYPKSALTKERTGSPIIVEAVITKEGTVACAKIIKSDHSDLSASVLEAISKWKYKPALKNGKPVPIRFTITIMIHVR